MPCVQHSQGQGKVPDVDTVLSQVFEQSLTVAPAQPKPGPTVRKQCVVCLSYIGRGKPHTCNKATKRSNLEGVVKASSRKSKARIVSAGIKNVFTEAGVSTRGGCLKLGTGGTSLTVTLGSQVKSLIKRPKWDHDSLIKLQTNNNFSD